MKTIPLTQGQVALVDDEDFEWLRPYNWCARYDHETHSFYAHTKIRVGASTLKIKMHRAVLRAGRGVVVDHENHDTLDNRRLNLKVTNHAGNARNKRLYKRNTSGVCGVSWHKQTSKWHAYISVNRRNVNLGYYADKQSAINAREAGNVKHGYNENHGKIMNGSTPPSAEVKSNGHDRRLYITNQSGCCGVSWYKSSGKWVARIARDGKSFHLGYYDNIENAIAAREAANANFGYPPSHGKKPA